MNHDKVYSKKKRWDNQNLWLVWRKLSHRCMCYQGRFPYRTHPDSTPSKLSIWKIWKDITFVLCLFYSDEAKFKNTGALSRHIYHYGLDRNPQWIILLCEWRILFTVFTKEAQWLQEEVDLVTRLKMEFQ